MGYLEIENITKNFKNHTALHEINLKIDDGIYGFLGPNGAGKTTLMRILATIINSDSGRIVYEGISWDQNPGKVRSMLGYLPQHFGCFKSMRAWECLDYIAVLKGLFDKSKRQKQIEYLLNEVNLSECSHKKIKAFSGGMLRRLGIAQSMLGTPKIVIIDLIFSIPG